MIQFSNLVNSRIPGIYHVFSLELRLKQHYQLSCNTLTLCAWKCMKLHLFHYSSLCFGCSRLKNVMFDISQCEEVGDFEIKAKFMGVEMEKVQLHFQVSSHVHRSSQHMAHVHFVSWACGNEFCYSKSLCFFVVYFQDLLQLQYEGVAVMKMFDKAKVNVNLLIFLLNKKFYGKWKSCWRV